MSKYLFDFLDDLAGFKNDIETSILTDIDGTISEIAATPEEAFVSPSMKKELSKLNEKYQMVGVISGRSVMNARSMVDVDGLLYIGNHGMEYLIDDEIFIDADAEKYMVDIKRMAKELKNSDLSKIEGLMFENKGICLCIHYRKCEIPENARKKILDNLNDSIDSNRFKLSEGRKNIELKPPISRDKGYIIEKIVEKYDLHRIIYLGDDVTDVDAFTKLEALENTGKISTATILVLSPEIPDNVKNSALFYVRSVNEVQRFFKWLLK
jgi:trehalose 6-phosphate phosphatase